MLPFKRPTQHTCSLKVSTCYLKSYILEGGVRSVEDGWGMSGGMRDLRHLCEHSQPDFGEWVGLAPSISPKGSLMLRKKNGCKPAQKIAKNMSFLGTYMARTTCLKMELRYLSPVFSLWHRWRNSIFRAMYFQSGVKKRRGGHWRGGRCALPPKAEWQYLSQNCNAVDWIWTSGCIWRAACTWWTGRM